MVVQKNTFTVRLSKKNRQRLLKGIRAKMKADKTSRNKCIEMIFDEYFLFKAYGHDMKEDFDREVRKQNK
jgi:hypothetical protein